LTVHILFKNAKLTTWKEPRILKKQVEIDGTTCLHQQIFNGEPCN
jgi:hypothetical protein